MSGTPRITRANIGVETWNGVVQRLEKLFDRNSLVAGNRDVVVVPVSNLENAQRALQTKGLATTLPYVAISPGAKEPNVSSYNPSVMRRFGVKSVLSDDRSTWVILRVVPVTTTYQVMIVSDDVLTQERMTDRWLAFETWGFSIKTGDYDIPIKVLADKSLQIPPLTPDSGGSDQFRLMTTLRAETYAGYVWRVPSIYQIDFSLSVNSLEKFLELEANGLVDDLSISRTIIAPDHEPAVV